MAPIGSNGVRSWWPAVLTPAVATAVFFIQFGGLSNPLPTVAGLVVAVLLASLISRQPGHALAFLVFFVPCQQVLLSGVLRLGAPVAVVRDMGYLKELVTLGMVLRALRDGVVFRRDTAVDRALYAFVALASLYLVTPFVTTALGAAPLHDRLLAWRSDCLWIVLLVAVRYARLSAQHLRAIQRSMTTTILLIAAGALVEFISPSTWNRLILDDLGLARFRFQVFGLGTPGSITDTTVVAGASIPRAGSLLLSPLALGHWAIVALAFSLQRLASERWSMVRVTAAGLAATTLILSGTRSAIFGGLVAALVVLVAGDAMQRVVRLRLRVTVFVAAVAALPLLLSSPALTRLDQGAQGSDTSTQSHLRSVQHAWNVVTAHPVGLGLGTGPVTGSSTASLTTENAYLQVAAEIGVLGGISFIACLVLLIRACRRARTDHPLIASAAAAALVGLAVNGLFLQVFLDPGTTLTMAVLAGMALAPGSTQSRQPDPSIERNGRIGGMQPRAHNVSLGAAAPVEQEP